MDSSIFRPLLEKFWLSSISNIEWNIETVLSVWFIHFSAYFYHIYIYIYSVIR